MRKYLTLFLSLVSLTISAAPHHYTFHRLGINDGLSGGAVFAIERDSRGFIWFGTSTGLERYDGYTVVNYQEQASDTTSLPGNLVNSIQEIPQSGSLWIKTDRGYSIMDRKTGKFDSQCRQVMLRIGSREVPDFVYVSPSNKRTWIHTPSEGLWVAEPDGKTARLIKQENFPENTEVKYITDCKDGVLVSFSNGQQFLFDANELNPIWRLDDLKDRGANDYNTFLDSQDLMWIYNLNGLLVYDLNAKEWRPEMASRWAEGTGVIIHAVAEDVDGNIWIGTDATGIDVFDKHTGYVTRLSHDETNNQTISNNTIQSLHLDQEGVMWVGSYKNGVACCYARPTGQEMYRLQDITCMVEADPEHLWLGTNGKGIIRWNLENGEIEPFALTGITENHPIVGLTQTSANNLYAATFMGGIYGIENGHAKHWTGPASGEKATEGQVANANVWSLKEDSKGNLWVATLGGGLQYLDLKTGTFTTYNIANEALPNDYLTSLDLSPDGRTLVLGFASIGVGFFDTETRKYSDIMVEHILPSGYDNPGSLPTNLKGVNQVMYDSRGLLWIVSNGGVGVYEEKHHSVKVFVNSVPQGLSITEDKNHKIWIATQRSIKQVSVTEHQEQTGSYVPTSWDFNVISYGETVGLLNSEFNQRSMTCLSDGRVIAGGINGIDIFDPNTMQHDSTASDVFFAGVRIMDKFLSGDINETRVINLTHNDKVVSIFLAANQYAQPGKNRFMYMLEGFSDKWMALPMGARTLTFTNLNPGKYVLHIKSADELAQKTGKEETMKINIAPPAWQTWWAYLFYFLLFLTIIILMWHWSLARVRTKERMAQMSQQMSHDEEVNRLKTQFYTNVSHELRTPLTLILGPLEKLMATVKDPEQKEQLGLMQRNANHLLDMVNQLLDFRKLEDGRVKLNLTEGDIVDFIRQVSTRFEPMSTHKQIRFSFYTEPESLTMAFDADKMDKIVSNLLSNALKFTPEKGRVTIQLETETDSTAGGITQDNLTIKVSDTGSGISDEDKKKIFDVFYQAMQKDTSATGSGIGLSMVKDFAELHGGSVSVYDNAGRGTIFKVKIPIRHIAPNAPDEKTPVAEPEVEENSEEATDPTAQNIQTTILICDDNDDFRLFMRTSLTGNHKVIEAVNGKEALKILEKTVPDCVISDIMMPEIDGNELCRCIREDSRLHLVPVLLISGLQTAEARIESLEAGADDYLTKPFSVKELNLRLKNLLEVSRLRQGKPRLIDPMPSDVKVVSQDEQLVKKAIQYVEENMGRSDLSVEDMSQELGMSRVMLYKKLLGLTGLSPIEFIRNIRLKRAAQYLRETPDRISEISYRVGFNNPKFFSRYFKALYGMLPTEYREKEGQK